MQNKFPVKAEKFGMSYNKHGSGENMCVHGLNKNNVCIGDVFRVKSNSSDRSNGIEVLFQVTSPRRPCGKWDIKYDALGKREKGVRHFMLQNTIAGWFMKPMTEGGKVCVGDTVELVHRPYPKWTLKLLGDKLYGQAKGQPRDWAQWIGTDEELNELANMEELAIEEWREIIEEIRAEKQGEMPRDLSYVEHANYAVQKFGSATSMNYLAMLGNGDPLTDEEKKDPKFVLAMTMIKGGRKKQKSKL